MKIAITGSRDIPEGRREVIDEKMATLVDDPDVDVIHFGGARGTDTIALIAAAERRKNARSEFVGVVPWTIDEQPKSGQKALDNFADKIVELEHSAPTGTGGGYQARNVEMIDRADRIVAFWNGEPGGTKNTIDAARDSGKPVEVIEL